MTGGCMFRSDSVPTTSHRHQAEMLPRRAPPLRHFAALTMVLGSLAVVTAIRANAATPEQAQRWLELPRAAATAFSRGAYEDAARVSTAALDQLAAQDMPKADKEGMRSFLLGFLGMSYDMLGQPARAEETLAKARRHAEASGLPAAKALSEVFMIALRARHGLDDGAMFPDLAASFRQQTGRDLTPQEAGLLAALTSGIRISEATKGWDPSKPPGSAESAPEIHLPPGDLPQALSEAQDAFMAHRYDRTIELLEPARKVFHDLGQRDMELAALALMAGAHAESLRFDEALALSLEAAALYDRLIDDVEIDDHLARMAGDRRSVYEMVISLLALKNRPEDAFFYAEKARARSLLRQLGPPHEALPTSDTRAQPREAATLRRELVELERSIASPGSAILLDLDAAKREPYKRHQQVLAELRLIDPAYASPMAIAPVASKTFRHEALDERTTAIIYYTFENWLLTWVMDRHGGVLINTPLPASVTGQKGDIDTFVDSIRAGESDADIAELARRLHRYLITPLRAHIQHPNVVIIPHGPLHFLPFAALRNPETDRLLVEDFALSYAPSASVLHHLRQRQTTDFARQEDALVVGDPDTGLRPLPAAQAGAKVLARQLAAEPLLGTEATEGAVRARSRTAHLLHVGAHAANRSEAPQLSHLALAADGEHDGHLTVREILYELEIEAQPLVVLSACSTAQGDQTRGDDVIGLTQAFLAAGSPTVVSTLWPVDDQAAERFNHFFYCHLARGLRTPEALRQAQRVLRTDPEYGAPVHWAAFASTGDPQRTWPLLQEAADRPMTRECSDQG